MTSLTSARPAAALSSSAWSAGRVARAGRSTGSIVAQAAVVLVGASLLTFALGAASGSDPAAVALGDMATPEDVARLNHEFGSTSRSSSAT